MRRALSALLLLPVIGCSGNPGPGGPERERAFVRLLDVSPPIGTRVGGEVHVVVRAQYEVPEDGEYHATLMFVTASGSTASGARPSSSVTLTEPAGEIELSASTSDLRHDLAEPLTAVVMLIGPHEDVAHADTITGSPAELRARLGSLVPDSTERADSARTRVQMRAVVRRAGPAAARSPAIFYNGAGPAAALRGPGLSFDQAIEEYGTYGVHKAFALARDEAGRRTWGYSFGYADPDSAVARALRECAERVAQRDIIAECRVHAIDEEFLNP